MKMLRLTQFVAAPMLMLLVSVPAVAAPLDRAHLPQDAKWVLHVDLDALSQTPLAQQVRQSRPAIVRQVRQWVQNRYGIDPREDLHSLTAFSDTYESKTGTVVLKANYDQQKVANELKNQQNVKTTSWENHTLYTVQKAGLLQAAQSNQQQSNQQQSNQQQSKQQQSNAANGKSVVIVLLDGETAIFASTAERAQAAVKLLSGNAPSLQQDSHLVADIPEGAIAYGAAVDLNTIKQRDGFFPVLRQHERIVWMLGQEGGEAFDRLTLVAQSEEVAEQMQKAIEGMVAFGKVWSTDSQSLKKLAEDTKVSRDGKTVERNWRGDNQVVFEAIGELSSRVQQRIEAVR